MGNQTSKKASPKASARTLGSETDYLSANSSQPSLQDAKRDSLSTRPTATTTGRNGGSSIEAANGRVQGTTTSHEKNANGNNSNNNPVSSLLGLPSHESATGAAPTALLASLPRARPNSSCESSPVQVNIDVVSGTILPSHAQDSSERRLKSSLVSSDLIQPPPAAHTQDSTPHHYQQQQQQQRHSSQGVVGPSSTGVSGQQQQQQQQQQQGNTSSQNGTGSTGPGAATTGAATTKTASGINNNINTNANINNNKDGVANVDSKLRQEHYDHIKNNIFGRSSSSDHDNDSVLPPANGNDDHQQAHQQSQANGVNSNKDTQQDQEHDHSHQEQEQEPPAPPPPEPSIPFAVLEPGEPILVKRPHLSPLIIPSSLPSSARSPPQTKSLELSPTARIPFLGSSDKSNKVVDIDEMISKLLDAGYSGKIAKSICLRNNEIVYICQTVREVFLSQPTLIELNAPVKIVGDIHGQYTDLLRMFEMCGFPPSANFLFLGDYVDRGKMSLETILLLFCYKIKYPENFFLLRGNHECASVTKVYGFYDECKRRASIKMWKAFVDVFNCLPLAAIVANKIFCVHGGLSPSLGTMDDIRALRRPTDVPDYGLLNDLLWSDPSDTALDWEDNERGVSYCFGRSIIQKFLNKHDFDLICRAHMVVEDGYEFFNDRALVTVFSAPNYCGEFDNFGAVMSVSEELLCSFELLKPIDQATARAQMQSLAATNGGWRVNKQRLSIPDGNSVYGVTQNTGFSN
ncbi:hypothetical protein EC957_008434 [Mortierella hygrophila]|uniref:Serine/threonine-protein phosphatase n=1 Tax=Mortierella hygrophila TaxID=979708 RepID=A0A9P6K551_9FUNG|nr:hypothetical protein EC957_008434 [Mortierella hygrophila]